MAVAAELGNVPPGAIFGVPGCFSPSLGVFLLDGGGCFSVSPGAFWSALWHPRASPVASQECHLECLLERLRMRLRMRPWSVSWSASQIKGCGLYTRGCEDKETCAAVRSPLDAQEANAGTSILSTGNSSQLLHAEQTSTQHVAKLAPHKLSVNSQSPNRA